MARFSVSGAKRRRAVSGPSTDSVGEEEEEAEKEDESSSPPKEERADSEAITVRIDPEVLDCPICFEAFAPPIFQFVGSIIAIECGFVVAKRAGSAAPYMCCNGHVTCSTCCAKMKNKCYLCPYPLGPNRCVALEKVLDSIRISCPYAGNGCRETLTYAQRGAHKESCRYSPCFCPYPMCEFEGYMPLLSNHFRTQHKASVSFKYNVPFYISLSESTSMQILTSEDDALYVLHSSHVISIGNSISLYGISPEILEGDLMYHLTVSGRESSLSFSTSVVGLRKWTGVSPSKEFLLVPYGFFHAHGRLNVEVCVSRVHG